MKMKVFSGLAVLAFALSVNAAVVEVTGITGHDGGNWPSTLGHLSDMVNGNLSNDLGTADHEPGMDISADPSDPSQWTYEHTGGWKSEWDANSRLDSTTSLNNKIGWAALDFGSVIQNLDTLYVWSQRDANRVDEGVKDYNLYYSSGVGIDALPAMPNSQSTTGDYDFSSGDWTQIGGTQTLGLSSSPYLPDNSVALGGVNAQYIGIEILTAQGEDTRVGIGQVEVTSAGIPEPASAVLLVLGGLFVARRRRR